MIVMKFGGTSVADPQAISRVIDIIKSDPNKKIVVVSAIDKGTRTLTKAFTLASQNNQEYKEEIEGLKKRHETIVCELISDKKLLLETKTKINALFLELNIALEETIESPASIDNIMAKILAFGELLSSTILHAAMLENDIKSELIDAREMIITNDEYKKANPILEKINFNVPYLINKNLDLDKTIVTQGFIGSNLLNETTLLGLEGSDLSASLIGSALDAKEIQIWTDVNGIMTGDPRKIKGTKNIPELSFEEAINLSSLGAKVIHPMTIEPAAKKNIPVRILSSLDPKLPGTLITNKTTSDTNKITSITYKEDVKVATIPLEEDILQKTLSTLERQNIKADAIIESEENAHIIFESDAPTENLYYELEPFTKLAIDEDCSLIGIIGKYDQNPRKMLENILKILDDFAVKMIVYDSSSTSIILVIEKNELLASLQELHDNLIS